jgi:cell division inhibitor SepF
VVEAQRFCIICQQEGFAQRARTSIPMAISDTWHRALVYFGLAEEEDPRYESVPDRERERPRERERERIVDREPEAELEDRYRERPNVRRLQRRRRDEFDDIFADESPRDAGRDTRVLRSVGDNGHAGMDQVHLVVPKAFNDAQEIANQFKDSIPVILNLQGVDPDLSKRLIDFSSGLTYALDGGMQRIADKVFLLTPRNVEVSAEERARLIEKGFFNQS